MASLTAVKYYGFVEAVFEGKHDCSSDSFKILLSNTTPTLTHTQRSEVGEISAGNGYTSGGYDVTEGVSSNSSGTYTFGMTIDETVEASGGTMASWRYIILYNDTATNDEVICYWDTGSEQTLTDGQKYDLNMTGPIFTSAYS